MTNNEHVFLNLGKQPLANSFLCKNQLNKEEYLFDLKVKFDENTGLVSLVNIPDKKLMFNDSYVYHSSGSETMQKHFRDIAVTIKEQFNPRNILEIGSNDGVFIRNFAKEKVVAIEPCGNFAELTNKLGYKTICEFWSEEVANDIGKFDVIYSANCMCHIPAICKAFAAVKISLSKNGIFIFEDPSLQSVISKNSYDQFYDEHAHIFSVLALTKLLKKAGLSIIKVERLDIHGGSNRIYATHSDNTTNNIQDSSVIDVISSEMMGRLNNIVKLREFAERVYWSKKRLVAVLQQYKNKGCKIIGYGATSKLNVVLNYCKITTDILDYIIDTTVDKQNKFTPGTHIPVISPQDGFNSSNNYNNVNLALLGAWNYASEIINKEEGYRVNGGKFITHVPKVRII